MDGILDIVMAIFNAIRGAILSVGFDGMYYAGLPILVIMTIILFMEALGRTIVLKPKSSIVKYDQPCFINLLQTKNFCLDQKVFSTDSLILRRLPIVSADPQRLLGELGFLKNVIIETVVTTYNADAKPNAAPMGVVRVGKDEVEIRPYKDTRTYENLRATKAAVVNVTDDVNVIHATAFKERGEVPTGWFEKASTVNAPRLRDAAAFIEVEAFDTSDMSAERAAFKCKVKLIEVMKIVPSAFNRSVFATIESIIHATRVKILLQKGKIKEADDLIRLINHYKKIVERVAPSDSPSFKVMKELEKMVAGWRRCQGR